jgi:hypothetical protein
MAQSVLQYQAIAEMQHAELWCALHGRDEEAVEMAVQGAMAEYKRPLHVYINCAGVEGEGGHAVS